MWTLTLETLITAEPENGKQSENMFKFSSNYYFLSINSISIDVMPIFKKKLKCLSIVYIIFNKGSVFLY